MITKLKVAHDTGQVHKTMTKAEQKRWSTWTNSMAVMTYVKKFYENAHIIYVGSGNSLQLKVMIFNDDYQPSELLKDLTDLLEEGTKTHYEINEEQCERTIIIKWELEPYDN